MPQPHFLIATFPAQGHINPTLQFAKRLIRIGAHVTFITSVYASRRMTKVPSAQGLSFLTISDGYDDGLKPGDDKDQYLSDVRHRFKETLNDLVVSSDKEGKPISCVVHTLVLSCAMEVAREHHIPSALLWIQAATVLDIHYYYFNGYEETIKAQAGESKCLIELPKLPPLASHDLPSSLIASNNHGFRSALSLLRKQFELLNEETNAKILVNTFDALEPEAIEAIENFKMLGVGPLIQSTLPDGKDLSDTSFKGDLFHCSKDYLQWLDSKPRSTVIYVSFGTVAVLAKQQMEEIAQALLASGRPFLWVIRDQRQIGEEEKEEDILSSREELEQFGMIVPWCSQVEVLSHHSLGCFVTHCGWNSTLESLVAGVPLVAFPQWTDQGTNAKLIQDVWKTGVRVTKNEDGIVESGEINRCLDLVMGDGERANELRRNAEKWKDLAKEAAMDGGSSDMNLKAFIHGVAN